jgi:AcrR family transcriptional regulator
MASRPEAEFKLRDRFKSDTRAAILEAAAAVFAANASGRVRMEDIAARAGIAVGTLYNYFQDRAALVGALLETRRQPLVDGLDRALAPGDTFDVRLDRFVRALADYFAANKSLLSVLLDEERSHGQDARAASRRRSVLKEVSARAERLLSEGVREGALRPGDPAFYAALLVGMMRGAAERELSGAADGARLADGTPGLLEIFLRGTAR